MLLILLQSNTIRFSIRGMHFTTAPLIEHAMHGWHRISQCHRARKALCRSADDMAFFSTSTVDIPDSWSNMTSNILTDTVRELNACQSSSSGREVRVGDSEYEVSLCDIYDMNMHFLYEPATATMYFRRDFSSIFELIVIALVSIFFISALSHNLVTMFADKAQSPQSKMSQARLQAGMVIATLGYFIIFFAILAPSFIITQTDTVLAVHLCLFIILEALGQLTLSHLMHDVACESVEWSAYMPYQRDNSVFDIFMRAVSIPVHPDNDSYISVLTACLLLLSCRIHFTFDTPYLTFLVVVFGTRSFYKLFRVLEGSTASGRPITGLEIFLQIIDVFVFCSLLGNGIAYATVNAYDSSISSQSTAFFSLCFGALLWLMRKQKQRAP